eukprot:scaffold73630_cov48-Phaeocystis_antarctica.AAC.2
MVGGTSRAEVGDGREVGGDVLARRPLERLSQCTPMPSSTSRTCTHHSAPRGVPLREGSLFISPITSRSQSASPAASRARWKPSTASAMDSRRHLAVACGSSQLVQPPAGRVSSRRASRAASVRSDGSEPRQSSHASATAGLDAVRSEVRSEVRSPWSTGSLGADCSARRVARAWRISNVTSAAPSCVSASETRSRASRERRIARTGARERAGSRSRSTNRWNCCCYGWRAAAVRC